MYPAQIIVEALNKTGSIQALADRVGVSDQAVRNWLNLSCHPTDARLKQLMAISISIPLPKPLSSWEQRQLEIEENTRFKPPVIEKPLHPDPIPPAKKAWKQRVEITRIHERADYAFGVTNEAHIVFIVPHVADKLKDAGIENGDEVTLVVRDNEHPNADLYAFKWIEDDADGY